MGTTTSLVVIAAAFVFALAIVVVLMVTLGYVESSSAAGRADAAAKPLAGVHVNIDPGHNPGNARHASRINRIVHRGPIRKACDTAGTSTNGGYPEWRFNGRVATLLATHLRRRGATVTYTRANGRPAWGPCVTQRASLGNRAHVAISLHADGASSSARGFHVIRPASVRGWTTRNRVVPRSSRLALQVRNELAALDGGIPPSTYIGKRGIDVRRDLGGLTLSSVPKVMVEHGNMRNATDARLLTSERYQRRIAEALARALTRWHLADRRAAGTS